MLSFIRMVLRRLGLQPAGRPAGTPSPTPNEPGGPTPYRPPWAATADPSTLGVVGPRGLGNAPEGWAGEYDPRQMHTAPGETSPRPQVQWSTDHVRHDGTAVRFQLRRGDTRILGSGPRAELSAEAPYEPPGVTRWYGFSLYPDHWPDAGSRIVTQWHHDGSDFSPPLSLGTREHRNETRWMISLRNFPHGDTIDYDAGPCAIGAWTDFVFHVRWASDSTGLLEVWKNDEPVDRVALFDAGGSDDPNAETESFCPRAGQTTIAPTTRHYIKIGLYCWEWGGSVNKDLPTTASHPDLPEPSSEDGDPDGASFSVLYHDELRIADQSASRMDVSPSSRGSG